MVRAAYLWFRRIPGSLWSAEAMGEKRRILPRCDGKAWDVVATAAIAVAQASIVGAVTPHAFPPHL